jgi:hypothetical protein
LRKKTVRVFIFDYYKFYIYRDTNIFSAMKKVYTFISFFLFFSLVTNSQENNTRISVFQSLQKKGVVESDFLQVQEGTIIGLQVFISENTRSKTIPAIMNGIGAGVLTYQSSRILSHSNKISENRKENLLAHFGVGIATTSASLFKRRSTSVIRFDFYDEDKNYLYSTTKQIQKLTPDQIIEQPVIHSGYVVVSMTKDKRGKFTNGYIDVLLTKPAITTNHLITIDDNTIFSPGAIISFDRSKSKHFNISDPIIPDISVFPIIPVALNNSIEKKSVGFKEETSSFTLEHSLPEIKPRGRKIKTIQTINEPILNSKEFVPTQKSKKHPLPRKKNRAQGLYFALKPRRRISIREYDDEYEDFDTGFTKYDDPIYMSTDSDDSYDGSSSVTVWGYRDPFPDYSYDPPSNDLPSYFWEDDPYYDGYYDEPATDIQYIQVPCKEGQIANYSPNDPNRGVTVKFVDPTNFTTKVTLPNGQIVDAPMPNIIVTDPRGGITTDPKYQRFDYEIAAFTALFNHLLSSGTLNLWWDNNTEDGYKLSQSSISTIPPLDPTLVKAIIMQESAMGTIPSNNALFDIMQVNNTVGNNADWANNKKHYGLIKGVYPDPVTSVWAGILNLATKGFRTSSGGLSNTFLGWNSATLSYNGGGAKNYKNVFDMIAESRKPTLDDYKFKHC